MCRACTVARPLADDSFVAEAAESVALQAEGAGRCTYRPRRNKLNPMISPAAVTPTPTPTPALPAEVSVILPTPIPFPTPIVVIESPEAWAWSLETLIASLGTAASVLATGLAVAVTIYVANRERRDRTLREATESRGRIGAAMLKYVDAQLTPERDSGAYIAVREAIAAAGLSLDDLERWLVENTEAVREWWQDAYPSGNRTIPTPGHLPWAFLASEALVKSTIMEWMTTGEAELPRVHRVDDVARPNLRSESSAPPTRLGVRRWLALERYEQCAGRIRKRHRGSRGSRPSPTEKESFGTD